MGDKIKNTESTLESEDKKLVGIRGWLILPAIGFVIGPIIGAMGLFYCVGIYSEVAEAGFGGLFALELAVLVALFCFQIYVAVLFFQKKKEAPKLIVYLYIINIVSSLVFLMLELNADANIFAEESKKQLIRDAISAAIWIPYFRMSKRVKATFVN